MHCLFHRTLQRSKTIAIITTGKPVVCTTPVRGYYRLSPSRGIEQFDTALQSLAAAKAAYFLCLVILATRKRVNILFQRHLIYIVVLFHLRLYIFLYRCLVTSYCINKISTTPEMTTSIFVF